MKLTLEEGIKRIHTKWPDAEFEVLEFDGSTKPFKFKCLKCGEVSRKAQFCAIFQHPNFCTNCTKKKYNDQIDKVLKEWNLIPVEHYMTKRADGKGTHHYVKIHCPTCNSTWNRVSEDIISKEMKGCPYCNKTKSSKQVFENLLFNYTQGEFSLVSDFKNNNKSVLIKHEECGFIFNYKPKSLVTNKNISCPKCKCYQSKGEEKIKKYLENNNIQYKSQVRFPDLGKYSYDFEIENNGQKYLIEFQGIQHYEPVKHFGGKTHFERQQLNDSIKKQYAEQHGYILIEIPYYKINEVNLYLDNIVQRLK